MITLCPCSEFIRNVLASIIGSCVGVVFGCFIGIFHTTIITHFLLLFTPISPTFSAFFRYLTLPNNPQNHPHKGKNKGKLFAIPHSRYTKDTSQGPCLFDVNFQF